MFFVLLALGICSKANSEKVTLGEREGGGGIEPAARMVSQDCNVRDGRLEANWQECEEESNADHHQDHHDQQ